MINLYWGPHPNSTNNKVLRLSLSNFCAPQYSALPIHPVKNNKHGIPTINDAILPGKRNGKIDLNQSFFSNGIGCILLSLRKEVEILKIRVIDDGISN